MDPMVLREAARETITSRQLTYRQRLQRLAQVGEGLLDPPKVSPEADEALATGLLCDLHEGPAPYRPRYLLPDYARALRQGSPFLELDPPADLDDAVAFLSILYHHVPSITGYPSFLGRLDQLLEPFTDGVDDARLHATLTRFWRYLDRAIPDALAHVNLGPDDGRVARTLLRIDRELGQVAPNVTLRWDPDRSGEALLDEAVRSIVAVNKPHIANEPMILRDFPADDFPAGYGVVSAYHTLPIGGGAHTLVRLNLAASVARHVGDVDDYLDVTLPRHLDLLLEVVAARTRFLVEEVGFYEHGFLVEEGLIDPGRFTAMAGVHGVAQAVDTLLGGDHLYGVEPDANELGHWITSVAAAAVARTDLPYCVDERAMLHAQQGTGEDVDVTAGARIPTGREPDTISHILAVAPHHRFYTAGISDIFPVEPSVRDNPSALSDLTRGAFAAGLREITFDVEDSELVRITGYMVRRADAERARTAEVRHDSTRHGAQVISNGQVLERASRVISIETLPFALGRR